MEESELRDRKEVRRGRGFRFERVRISTSSPKIFDKK